MAQRLQVNREHVWRLKEGSPFPDELEIHVSANDRRHGTIKPRGGIRLTKEQLEEVN